MFGRLWRSSEASIFHLTGLVCLVNQISTTVEIHCNRNVRG